MAAFLNKGISKQDNYHFCKLGVRAFKKYFLTLFANLLEAAIDPYRQHAENLWFNIITATVSLCLLNQLNFLD